VIREKNIKNPSLGGRRSGRGIASGVILNANKTSAIANRTKESASQTSISASRSAALLGVLSPLRPPLAPPRRPLPRPPPFLHKQVNNRLMYNQTVLPRLTWLGRGLQQRQPLRVAARHGTREIEVAVRLRFRFSWDALYYAMCRKCFMDELRDDTGWKSRDNLVSRAVLAERGRASKMKRVLRRENHAKPDPFRRLPRQRCFISIHGVELNVDHPRCEGCRCRSSSIRSVLEAVRLQRNQYLPDHLLQAPARFIYDPTKHTSPKCRGTIWIPRRQIHWRRLLSQRRVIKSADGALLEGRTWTVPCASAKGTRSHPVDTCPVPLSRSRDESLAEGGSSERPNRDEEQRSRRNGNGGQVSKKTG
jgi:hypothetical protein